MYCLPYSEMHVRVNLNKKAPPKYVTDKSALQMQINLSGKFKAFLHHKLILLYAHSTQAMPNPEKKSLRDFSTWKMCNSHEYEDVKFQSEVQAHN